MSKVSLNLEVVMQTSQVMIVSDEEHLSPASRPLDVSCYETQDVLMPEDEDDDDEFHWKDWSFDIKLRMCPYCPRFSFHLISPHQNRLVDFCLSEPACLLCCEEHLEMINHWKWIKTNVLRKSFVNIKNGVKKTFWYKNVGKQNLDKQREQIKSILFLKTLTATRSPLHLANHTSPYLSGDHYIMKRKQWKSKKRFC